MTERARSSTVTKRGARGRARALQALVRASFIHGHCCRFRTLYAGTQKRCIRQKTPCHRIAFRVLPVQKAVNAPVYQVYFLGRFLRRVAIRIMDSSGLVRESPMLHDLNVDYHEARKTYNLSSLVSENIPLPTTKRCNETTEQPSGSDGK